MLAALLATLQFLTYSCSIRRCHLAGLDSHTHWVTRMPNTDTISRAPQGRAPLGLAQRPLDEGSS